MSGASAAAARPSLPDFRPRFSPYYNGLSSPELAKQGRREIRVLISTDVLSEGLNLQDASRMINGSLASVRGSPSSWSAASARAAPMPTPSIPA